MAQIKIKNVIYHFVMKENGAKTMNLYVGTLKITDFRECTKNTVNKRIIFNFSENQFFTKEGFNENEACFNSFSDPLEKYGKRNVFSDDKMELSQ